MLREGVALWTCQISSTATFSTLFLFSLQLQKKSRGITEHGVIRVITEIIKVQLTKRFLNQGFSKGTELSQWEVHLGATKAVLVAWMSCEGKGAANPMGTGCCQEHRHNTGYKHLQLRGLVWFLGRPGLFLFGFSKNLPSQLHRGQPSIGNAACQES